MAGRPMGTMLTFCLLDSSERGPRRDADPRRRTGPRQRESKGDGLALAHGLPAAGQVRPVWLQESQPHVQSYRDL